MLINGEKYACEACVRGHRVSNCRHDDRKLMHIQKKGRPISQCPHCRAARKSRSAHVKCDCGEKTQKCVHLQPPKEGHRETCCCNHGAPCTCAHQKDMLVNGSPEPVDSDPERPLVVKSKVAGLSSSSSSSSSARRRRANTSNSESVLSASAKPRPLQNGGSHGLKRGATMHGTGTLIRSVDNLAHFGEMANHSQTASAASTSDHTARLVRSEQASPMVAGTSSLRQANGQLPPPLDLSSIQYTDYSGMFNSPSGLDPDAPIFSARLGSSADWNRYDGQASSSFDSIQPFAFDLHSGLNSGEPTLAPNSGNVSETEDFASPWDVHFDAIGSLDNFADGLDENVAISGEVDSLEFDLSKDPAALEKLMPYGNPVGSACDDAFWAVSNFNDGFSMSPEPIGGTHLWDGSM